MRITGTKVVALALLAILAAPLIAVASGAEEGGSDQPVEIRFHGRVGSQGDHFDRMRDIFNEMHGPAVTVKTEHFPGPEYATKINTLIAGGTLGDAFWTASIEGFNSFAASGVYEPLEELVAAESFDLAAYFPSTVEALTFDGNLYGLPWGVHPGWYGLYYNKAMFDEAGVDYPTAEWTYEDLLAAAKQIARPDEGIYGYATPLNYWGFEAATRAFGGDPLSADGATVTLGEADARAALQFLVDAIFTHRITPSPEDIVGGINPMIAAGQIAMATGGFWVGSGLTNLMESRDAWGVVPHPYGLGSNPARGQQIHVDVLGINSASEHKNAAFRFIALACSEEGAFDLWKNTGFPSARHDVIRRDEVKGDAHFQVFATGLGESWAAHQPANHRTQEFMRTIASGLQSVWVGETSLDETLPDVVRKAQEVVDRPPAS